MGGKLPKSGDREGIEASGVYLGVLQEDMIETVRKVKKPYADVFVKSLFFETADYPLTYVPMFNMVLPLKSGQKVWVYFNQENHRYPVLWKLADGLDKPFIDKNFPLPTGFPTADDTADVHKFSEKMWFITTKSYGVLHWGDQCILLNDDKILIGNNIGSMGEMVDDILTELIKLKTTGSPTNHMISPDSVTRLTKIKAKWNQVFTNKR